MHKLMLVCAGLAVVSGIVSVSLWRDLRHERELNAELQVQLADARSQPAQAGRGRYAPPAAPAARAQDYQIDPPSAADSAAAAEEADRRFDARRREQQSDPEYRKTFMLRTRMTLARRYPGLVEAVGLTAEEADKLFGILAERELGMLDLAVQVADLPEDQHLEARENSIGELNRKRDDALAALLGTRLQRFREYDQEMPGWNQVAEFNRMLGTPLNADQSKPLVATLLAEQKRMRDALQGKAMGVGSDPAAQARMAEELLEYLTEANRRTLNSARSYLTASQLEVLQAMFERQEQSLRSESRFLQNLPTPLTRP